MLEYLEKILFPYVILTREKLGLEHNQPVLVIFDRFRAQCTDRILSLLEDHHVHMAIVPTNCTIRLQPLDVSVDKAAKDFLLRKFGMLIKYLYKFTNSSKKTKHLNLLTSE